MPLIGVRLSTWCKPPWAMLRLLLRESIFMPDQRIARPGILEYEMAMAVALMIGGASEEGQFSLDKTGSWFGDWWLFIA